MICKLATAVNRPLLKNSTKPLRRLAIVSTLLLTVSLLGILAGCDRADVDVDRLYALHLAAPPTASDWQRALPRKIVVRGGRVHKIDVFPDIDKDTVHTSTPSCHHGGAMPKPLDVEMRAFYTDSDLFLQLSWRDLTRDANMHQWQFNGEQWENNAALEDGFGLMWQPPEDNRPFTCTLACHIENFGVADATFHASNRMKLADPDHWFDLWNWKADRTGRLGFADDRYLDDQGLHGDLPGELLRANSQLLSADPQAKPFGSEDRPVYDGEGQKIGKEFRPAGSLAPGWLVERPGGHRGDVKASAEWTDNRWTVVLRRSLDTGDRHDVRFTPDQPQGFAFGLSVMDHTLSEHYASRGSERLILLPKTAADTRRPDY